MIWGHAGSVHAGGGSHEVPRARRAVGSFPPTRRRAFLLVGLVAAGIGLLVWAVMPRPPQAPAGLVMDGNELVVPSASPTRVDDPVPNGPSESATHADTGDGQVVVEIPALEVQVPVGADLRRDARGNWLPGSWELGRWSESAPLGASSGTTMLAGHVWVGQQPGVLASLRHIQAGNVVVVRDGGRVERFLVSSIAEYPREALPDSAWGGRSGPRKLVLVTCAGRATDDGDGHRYWSHNLVVEAVSWHG